MVQYLSCRSNKQDHQWPNQYTISTGTLLQWIKIRTTFNLLGLRNTGTVMPSRIEHGRNCTRVKPTSMRDARPRPDGAPCCNRCSPRRRVRLLPGGCLRDRFLPVRQYRFRRRWRQRLQCLSRPDPPGRLCDPRWNRSDHCCRTIPQRQSVLGEGLSIRRKFSAPPGRALEIYRARLEREGAWLEWLDDGTVSLEAWNLWRAYAVLFTNEAKMRRKWGKW